jgi:hypothetical protein
MFAHHVDNVTSGYDGNSAPQIGAQLRRQAVWMCRRQAQCMLGVRRGAIVQPYGTLFLQAIVAQVFRLLPAGLV